MTTADGKEIAAAVFYMGGKIRKFLIEAMHFIAPFAIMKRNCEQVSFWKTTEEDRQ